MAKLTNYSTMPHRPSDSSGSRQRLLLSGDVHQNPGPATKYPCSVCTRNVTSRGVSYMCNRCSGWVHSKCFSRVFLSVINFAMVSHVLTLSFFSYTPASFLLASSFFISSTSRFNYWFSFLTSTNSFITHRPHLNMATPFPTIFHPHRHPYLTLFILTLQPFLLESIPKIIAVILTMSNTTLHPGYMCNLYGFHLFSI